MLRTVIEQQRIVKAPLYTCFVDFKKAYDTVPRDMLWTKLQRLGVHGWFLDGKKALFAEVPMAVKTAQGLTCTFDSVMGVKQGCPLRIKFSSEDLEGAGHARTKRFKKSLRRCINCPPGFSSNRQRLFPALAVGFLCRANF